MSWLAEGRQRRSFREGPRNELGVGGHTIEGASEVALLAFSLATAGVEREGVGSGTEGAQLRSVLSEAEELVQGGEV